MLIKSLCICLLTAVVGICEAKELRGLVVDAETGIVWKMCRFVLVSQRLLAEEVVASR